MKSYYLYGYHISSDIELHKIPDFITNDKVDIVIKEQSIPLNIKTNTLDEYQYVANDDYIYVFFPERGHFYAENGTTIFYEPLKNVDHRSVSSILITSGLTSLFYQRELLILHGSAMVNSDGNSATLFCGDSGVGKSSLVSTYIKDNVQVITDDICVISKNNHDFLINNSGAYIKVFPHVAKNIQLPLNSQFSFDPLINKVAYSITNTTNNIKYPIKNIIHLEVSDDIKEIKIEKLSSKDAIINCIKNSFKQHFIRHTKYQKLNFSLVTSLSIGNIKMYKVTRPTSSTDPLKLKNAINSII